MQDDELISVIVPIYNVEKYLRKCIDSILNQTYRHLEIILVDDGSSDNCPSICDEYNKMDTRIRVIHKKNGGVSSARNTGLDAAKGDFIAFVDSDDYLELDMYEKLINNMKKYNSDIAVCDYYSDENDKKNIKKYNGLNKSFSVKGKDKYKNLQNEYMRLATYPWNKIYSKSIFEKVRYPEGRIYEDVYVICDLLDLANSVSYLIEPLYHYVIRENGITSTFSIKQFDIIESFNQRIKKMNEKGYYDLSSEEENKKMKALITNLSKMKRYKIKNKKVYKKYYRELLDTNKEVKWKNATWKNKLFKVLRRPSISILAFGLRIRDLIKR